MNTYTAYDILFVATSNYIRFFNVSDPDDPGTYIPLEDVAVCVAIDYDPSEDYVYWTDVSRHTISRARSTGEGQEVLVSDVKVSDGLTLDIDSRMMYWTDTGKKTIERSFMNGTDRTVLISTELGEPRAILLNKELGKMYWTDWGTGFNRIERANTDGSEREVLVDTNLTNPFGLAFDFTEGRMYWAEAWLDNFESSDMNGEDRKLIYHEDGINPFSIALHGEYLYWSDWNKRNVQRITRFTKPNSTQIVLTTGYKMLGIKAVTVNGINILLVGDFYEIRKVNVDIEKHLGTKLPLTSKQVLPLAIDYDPINDVIYWCDHTLNSIRSARINGSEERAIVTEDVDYLPDLALSWQTGELFWTDSGRRVIEKIDLADNVRRTVISADIVSPYGIAVDMSNRYIYWTDEATGKIERALYDGDNRTLIIGGLSTPVAIVLDLDNNLMYWSEYGSSKIKQANLDGANIMEFPISVNSLALTILDDYIYMTDHKRDVTLRANRFPRGDASVVLQRERFMGIRMIEDITDCSHSPCLNQGSCIQRNLGHTCQCVSGYSGQNCETDIDECSSVPCQNDGTCVDRINNYICNCLPGYTGINCETDTDECESRPCQNHGTCIDRANGYTCNCPPRYTGQNCEAEIYPCASSPCLHSGICGVIYGEVVCSCKDNWFGAVCQHDSLVIKSLSPDVGPIAGGTRITINAEELPSSEAEIAIGNIANCTTLTSNSTTIITITPAVDDIYIEKKNRIYVSFPEKHLNFSTEFYFTYKANPTVTSVRPLETLKRGGTRLTVAGYHFDAVKEPLLKVDHLRQEIEISGDERRLINETIITYYEHCTSLNETTLICITPDLNASETTVSFVGDIPTSRRRRDLSDERQQEAIRQRRESEGRIETLDKLYIGIILDGVNKFRNLSANIDTKRYGQLTIISPPQFSESKQAFHFRQGEPIDIKGDGLDELTVDDYAVDVSSGHCDIVSITRNVLQCYPPQKEPPADSETSSQGHLVVVHIGVRIRQSVGFLQYPFNAAFYIGLGVVAVIVFVSVIVISIVCACRCRQRKKDEDNIDDGTHDMDEVIDLPPVVVDYSAPAKQHLTCRPDNTNKAIVRPNYGQQSDRRRRVHSLYPE